MYTVDKQCHCSKTSQMITLHLSQMPTGLRKTFLPIEQCNLGFDCPHTSCCYHRDCPTTDRKYALDPDLKEIEE